MLVLINGLPYFGKMIAKELNKRDQLNKYVFLDTYYSKWDKLKLRLLLPFSRAFISFNGVSDRSGSLDLVLKKRKKLVMQWHGSDVKIAIERKREGQLYAPYIDNAIHVFSAPWFEQELFGIVDSGVYAPISFVEDFAGQHQYDAIRVLSYLAEGKEEYYGWEYIRHLAELYPTFQFTIVGTSGEQLEKIANVHFHGWVNKDLMNDLYKSHALFVRLCGHDGKSFAVSQALAMGCEVLWNYAQHGVHQVERNKESITSCFEHAIAIIEKRNFMSNQQNIQIARDELSKEQVLGQYVDQIRLILSQ